MLSQEERESLSALARVGKESVERTECILYPKVRVSNSRPYMLVMRKQKKQRQIDPLMMDARKKEEILSPPFDALSYAAIMKVETANC